MKKAAAHPTTKSHLGSDNFSLGTLALDFLDTTWRIAVPVVLFSAIGIFIDIKADTAPWVTLLGSVVGFVFAGLLLKKQLQAAQEQEENKK